MVKPLGLAALPFVQTTPAGLDLWPGEDADAGYRELNERGQVRALAVIDYMRDNQAPMVLGHVVSAMISKGVSGPLEIGFASAIAMSLMGGAESAENDRQADRRASRFERSTPALN